MRILSGTSENDDEFKHIFQNVSIKETDVERIKDPGPASGP